MEHILYIMHLLLFYFESTFIKARDSRTRKGLAQKQQQESPGSAALAYWEVREKGARFTGLARDELPLPIASLVASPMGTLRV